MLTIQRRAGPTEPVKCHICGKPLKGNIEYLVTQTRTDRPGIYTVKYSHLECNLERHRQRAKRGWPRRTP